MFLEKGMENYPTGNLVLYCYVRGENPFEADHEIIASNVVVSFIKMGDNFPVVTFPPISYKTIEDLKKVILESGDTHDVAKLPVFELPFNKDEAEKYVQYRMEQYNTAVMRYVDLCRNKEKPEIKFTGEKDIDYLMALTNLSYKFRNSKGLGKEAIKTEVDELLQSFSIRYPQYDTENYRLALLYPGEKGEELTSLYLKKFNAISQEKYEEASTYKQKIDSIANLYIR